MNRAGVPGRHARFLLLGRRADGCNCYGMMPGGCFHFGNNCPVFGWINLVVWYNVVSGLSHFD